MTEAAYSAIVPASSGTIGFSKEPFCRTAVKTLSALFFCCTFAHGQTIAFELQNHPDSPIALVNFTPTAYRIESDRRQFLTVKNVSDKVTATVVFQQALSSGQEPK